MVDKAEYLVIEVEAVNGTNPNAVRDVMSRVKVDHLHLSWQPWWGSKDGGSVA